MEEVPLVKALDAKYSKDAVIVGISIDGSLERADRTIKEKGMTWPPTVLVLDRDGKIFAKPNSAKQIEEHLQKALHAAP